MTRAVDNYATIPAAEVLLAAGSPLIRAVELIDSSAAKIVLVVDESGTLAGSVTDGDIRRGLLHGHTLQSPVSAIMHADPYTLPHGSSRKRILEEMQSRRIKQIPLVCGKNCPVSVVTYDLLTEFEPKRRDNPVVIMAGGKGKRLWPLTRAVPKPMIPVGDRPILERIIQQFTQQGFHRFYISINYLGDVIENYFGDGSNFDCEITYVREEEFLGTAGALSLIEATFDLPFIVINGDILTSVHFGDLVHYHRENNGAATVCARTHHVEVPFGVIQLKNGALHDIREKPVYEDLVSAGVYVFEPSVLTQLSRDTVMQMPELLVSLVRQGKRVSVFPMREDWVDVGRPDDLERAKRAFEIESEGQDMLLKARKLVSSQ